MATCCSQSALKRKFDGEILDDLSSKVQSSKMLRRKIKSENNDCNSGEQKFSWTLVPVLSDEYYSEVKTELMYVAEITDRKQTSRLVKELSNVFPLIEFPHLKRVRNRKDGVLEIILCSASEIDRKVDDIECHNQVPLQEVLQNAAIDRRGLKEETFLCSVPRCAPLTRSQYEACLNIWPVQFHEDKYIASVLNDKLFTSADKEKMQEFMTMAIVAAKQSLTKVGAVITNSTTKEVVAVAQDFRDKHPLQHAVMVALDLVALSQGGGAWKLNNVGCNYALSGSNISQTKNSEQLTHPSELPKAEKLSGPYLCTGYDLYITREPCTMCSMALVHSRIHRVFYGNAVSSGGLGSHYKIHVQEGLNHHFEVWKGLMLTECCKLLEDNSEHCYSKNKIS